MKNILVTGGLGFIGFNAVQQWHKIYPDLNIIIVDTETYAAQFKINDKKLWIAQNNNIFCYKADICDENSINEIIERHNIDTIVNFAAESHVDNSIKEPTPFFNTNVMGVVNLLNISKRYNLRFHQVSTDEVYGISYPSDCVDESSQLKPSSPYSSSKASADLIALSYFKTYGTKITISRCTNNFGEWQHPEKLIPLVIKKALNDENIPVYGSGEQYRHWISVHEHNRIIMEILKNGDVGEIYNITPAANNYRTNIDIIKFILNNLNKSEQLITHVTDRAGHDTSYFISSSHGYTYSNKDYIEDLIKTINWYKENI